MALKLALASDTLSIALMEIVDNSIIMVIPGAMKATLSDQLFWISLFASLLLAGAAAFPLVRWLIGKGQGHAVIHHYHGLGGHKVSDTHADHHHHH
jgi:ABC-type nickel/cobalt efflux system permease component RcnA